MRRLVVFVDIMNIKESGWWQWGKYFTVKEKRHGIQGIPCCCSKEGWYNSWPFTTQKFQGCVNERWKIFMCLSFAVWLNRETFYH